MKTWSMIVTCCLVSVLHAMELVEMHDYVPVKEYSYKLVNSKDWPFLSFNNVKDGLNLLSNNSYKKLRESPQLLIASVATLPRDVIKLIIQKMFDGDKKTADIFMDMPIVHAFVWHQQKRTEFESYSNVQDKSFGIFCRLTDSQKQQLSRFLQPSVTGKLIFDDIALTDEELIGLDQIDQEVKEAFITGRQVFVIPPKQARFCRPTGITMAVGVAAMSGMLFGTFVAMLSFFSGSTQASRLQLVKDSTIAGAVSGSIAMCMALIVWGICVGHGFKRDAQPRTL